MSLTKSDMVEIISRELGPSKKMATNLVELIFNVLKEQLARGGPVNIMGLGSFVVKEKAGRIGRNPQTGATMRIVARRAVAFKASNILKEDIMSRYAHRLRPDGGEDLHRPAKQGQDKTLKFFINNDNNIETDKDGYYE